MTLSNILCIKDLEEAANPVLSKTVRGTYHFYSSAKSS